MTEPRVKGHEVTPAVGEMVTVYRVYTEGALLYSGPDLSEAARTWDAATFNLGRTVPGGIAVASYQGVTCEPGLLQMRDGWILHVHEDGTVYIHPSIKEG